MSRIGAEGERPLILQIARQDWMVQERAAVVEQSDVSDFILCHALAAAHKLIEQAAAVTLSVRDSPRVLDLEKRPAPKAKLLAAAHRSPKHP